MTAPPAVAHAYPKIEDPINIGVAVSSPGDKTPASTHSVNSMTNLLPSPPAWQKNHSPREPSPPRDAYDQPDSPFGSAGADPGSPERLVIRQSISSMSSAPNLQRPPNIATLPRVNEVRRAAPRESTQSTGTIINDEPMSPPPRLSIVKDHFNAAVRDYVPSYHMRSPTSPVATRPADVVQHSRIQGGPSITPPLSKFCPPEVVSSTPGQQLKFHTSNATSGDDAVSTGAQGSPKRADNSSLKKPIERSSPAPATPPTNLFGLPANPRSPPPNTRTACSSRSITPSTSTSDDSDKLLASKRRSPPVTSSEHSYETTPLSVRPHIASESMQKPKPPTARRASRKSKYRASSASVTSFETSSDERDASPSNHNLRHGKQLSPLPEISGERSPISGLQYPRVPRPANQSISACSGSPSRSGSSGSTKRRLRSATSSSSLLEKRKGSNAASNLQKALWITGSNGRTGPSTSHGQRFPVQANSRQEERSSTGANRCGPEMQMASPPWQLKLTPKRNSDGGLMIEVS